MNKRLQGPGIGSTYFEGQALGNEKAARGYSRDSRGDCKQAPIGLVCAPEGLPLNYEVFAGNRADVTTVEEIVAKMEDRFGQAERVWVMDRGMVSEKNIAFLRQRKALYIVGAPKSQLKDFSAELAQQENWTDVQDGVEARLVEPPDGDPNERLVLCRSNARAAKERAMLERQMDRLCEELLKLDRSLRHRPQLDTGPSERRIGRWQGRYPAAAKWINVQLLHDQQKRACGLRLTCPLPHHGHPMLAKGAYLLRTNCPQNDPAKLWRWYIQLTQAEAAFRPAKSAFSTTKSDIGLRPIYHQKTQRVEAHQKAPVHLQPITGRPRTRTSPPEAFLRGALVYSKTQRAQAHPLLCFLSLALWRSLESWMNAKGLGSPAAKLLEAVSTIRSMDVVVPVKRAEHTMDLVIPVKRAAGAIELRLRTLVKRAKRIINLRLRTVAKPDQDVATLLAHLGLKLPKGSKLVQNVVEKNH